MYGKMFQTTSQIMVEYIDSLVGGFNHLEKY
jgi:hypothetical protein